jgi:farnesyl diphosphate synthase
MVGDFPSELKAAASATEALLDRLLTDDGGEADAHRPARLTAAMRYAALGPGKRLRPFLLIESARVFGMTGEGVVRAAAALECVHCYSLVHDDLPAMDDDDMRRGRPTVHKAYDEASAILAGDALLTLAFAILADPATDPDAKVRTELVAGLAAAAGAAGMVGGQMLDLAAEKRKLGEAEIRTMQAMKTGALFRYACEAGAIVGRASAPKRTRLAEFGAALGLVFQLADDLIDATGKAAKAGKATAKDATRGKATLVRLHGVRAAAALLDKAVEDAIALIAPFGSQGDCLAAAARFAGRREA